MQRCCKHEFSCRSRPKPIIVWKRKPMPSGGSRLIPTSMLVVCCSTPPIITPCKRMKRLPWWIALHRPAVSLITTSGSWCRSSMPPVNVPLATTDTESKKPTPCRQTALPTLLLSCAMFSAALPDMSAGNARLFSRKASLTNPRFVSN